MTTICLVRHGETDWNRAGMLQGRTDTPLNQKGISQARECASYLTKFQWDVVVTSPLARAKTTAEMISNAIGAPLVVLDEFVEGSYGKAEGMTPEQRAIAFPDHKFPGREKPEEMQDRAMIGLNKILENYANKRILLVAHGGIIHVTLRAVSNGKVGTGKLEVSNTSLSHIQHQDGVWEVVNINQTIHLSEPDKKMIFEF